MVVVLAVVWGAAALISTPSANADEVPGPLLLAGSDCDATGPFVQYRVTNESDRDETLTIAVDDQTVIGSARIGSAETKRGRIQWQGSAAQSVILEARWATNERAPTSTITVAPNPCVTTSAADFTGPAFMAGTDCRPDGAIVRWWMSNSAGEDRVSYVSISTEDGSVGETIWPADGSSELMFAGAQTSGVAAIPADYVPGTNIRVSGWAEGSFGGAETWTQMVIPACTTEGVVLAGASSAVPTSVAGTVLTATSSGPVGSTLATLVATTGAAGTSTSPPIATTSSLPGETTTVAPSSSTTSVPPPTTPTTVTTTTTRPPGSTTSTTSTRPPSTTTTTSTTSPPPSTTTTTTTTPPADVVPPVFLAGADCNDNGPFIRYRVTNNNVAAQRLTVTFNGATRVDSLEVDGGQTKWGTFTAGGPNDPKPVVASWVGHGGSQAPSLLMRASICADGLPQPARGPSFVAGQDCSGNSPIVRWWMKNSAPTTHPMNVTVTKADNTGEITIWPAGGGTVEISPGVQTSGVYTLPSGYNRAGQEIRVRGWWRQLDASAHNRVGIVLAGC